MSSLRRKSSASTSSLNRMSLSSTKSVSNLATTHKQQATHKKSILTKPAWDSNLNDLSQLKATQEELERRKLAHQSKNAELVKLERQQKMKRSEQKTADPKAQLALLKQILLDDEQLKSMIFKSDSTLKTVKSIFQDDHDDNQSLISNLNNKKAAKMVYTLAPNVVDLEESNLPHELAIKNVTKANVINVNSFSPPCSRASEKEQTGFNEANQLIDNKLKKLKNENDLNAYKHLLELKQKLQETLNSATTKSKPTSSNEFNLNELKECLKLITQKENEDVQLKSKLNMDKLSQIKQLLDENETETHNQNTLNNQTLTDMNSEFNRALIELEMKMNEFDKQANKQSNLNATGFNSKQQIAKNKCPTNTSSTFTLSIIQIIAKLVDHLKETSNELNHEKLKHAESHKQLDIHRKLIDGLTHEILYVKEQNEKILNEYINQQAKLEAELDQIKLILRSFQYIDQQQQQSKTKSVQMRPSAFTSQSTLDQTKLNQRPMSCMSTLSNEFITQSSQSMLDNALLNGNLNFSKNHGDKFTERLNAMLLNDVSNQLAKSTSAFNFQPLVDNKFIPVANQRSLSASFNNLKTARTKEMNNQIEELTSKNAQAQLKFKELQSEHKQLANKCSPNDESKEEALLEKLKQEKQTLKEQIVMLNKQRESAQMELETLTLNKNGNELIGEKQLKSLQQIVINANNNLDINTPTLSPISGENYFQQGIQCKSSAKCQPAELSGDECLEVTPKNKLKQRK